MAHKKIQALSLQGQFTTKAEAIKAMEEYVVANIGDFIDGESVTVRYSDATGEVCSVGGIVNIAGNNVSVSVAIEEHETMKVVESDTAPEDKDVLWVDTSLSDNSGATGSTTEIIQQDIQALNRAIQSLYTIVDRHQYAFEHTINPGDITNSAKGDMEDFADPEPPAGYENYDTSGDTDFEYNESGMPMEKPVIVEPTAKHILVKYAATLNDIKKMQAYILEHEMVWCDGNMTMYIKAKGQLWPVSGRGNGEVIPGGDDSGNTNPDIDINEIMSGITQSGASIASIQFVAPSGAKYITAVDNNGKLNVYNEEEFEMLNTVQSASYSSNANISSVTENGVEVATTSELYLQKLYINMIYCGGVSGALNAEGKNNSTIDEHSYNYCSHNFVELANLTNSDISLNGITLQYSEGGTKWYDLPLKGIIKSGSTYLVRGAQCSVMDANTTIIKVKTYDMEWNVNKDGKYDPKGSGIQFSNMNAKFYLKCSTASTIQNPYISVVADAKTTATTMQYGYIDLVGVQNKATGVPSNDPKGYEKAVNTKINSNRILAKYYTMDPVSQATKAFAVRNNANDWTYVDLSKKVGEVIPNIECYTPKASWEGKNIFFNKTGLKEDRPTVITCSFGIQATDNGAGATRCFNWISKGYQDEYLWINSSKSFAGAQKHESMKGETNPTKAAYYYNRIRQEATDGTPFTVHKLIVKNLSAGTYYYAAGPDSAHTTEWHSFKVVTDAVANEGFSFVQTSDQQGFNWEEYQVWKACADYITENETPAFMINTGDMAQNGNRINEWLDYFNAKGELNDIEEMATIGNNDLCPSNPFILGTGADTTKVNSVNITYYYTFELDEDNLPVFNVEGPQNTVENLYIPSLYSFNYGNVHFICMNSEIGYSTEALVYGLTGVNEKNCGYIYTNIKNWCVKDAQKYGKTSSWNIAYCHEMPFTIITNAVKNKFYDGVTENQGNQRGGSRLNVATQNPYWFSRFCQENNVRLVIGGHKHTQATTWPLKENVKDGVTISMKPIIQVTADDLKNSFSGSTKLMTVNDASSSLNGYSYPEKMFKADGSLNDAQFSASTHFCTFELVDKVTAPVYAMSQSSGYKHTSNKELPAVIIPWERHYHPCSVKDGIDNASATQKFPFYTIWTISSDNIEGVVKKVGGIFNASGKYNINEEGAKVKKGQSADADNYSTIMAVNGIDQNNKTNDFTTIVKIEK